MYKVKISILGKLIRHTVNGKRATCETWIEESKNQMALAHIKTASFFANAAIFQCAVLAYNIVRWMAALSNNKRLMRWEAKTIRCFIIRVAGRLIKGSRQLVLKTPSSLLFKNQWVAWLKYATWLTVLLSVSIHPELRYALYRDWYALKPEKSGILINRAAWLPHNTGKMSWLGRKANRKPGAVASSTSKTCSRS